jgi:hypothetical protein
VSLDIAVKGLEEVLRVGGASARPAHAGEGAAATAARWTMRSSSGVWGRYWWVRVRVWKSMSCWTWAGKTDVEEKTCVTALARLLALPSGVMGPRECLPFWREAWIWAGAAHGDVFLFDGSGC